MILESIVSAGIVAFAAFLFGRQIYREFAAKPVAGCSRGCGGCALGEDGDSLSTTFEKLNEDLRRDLA
ncbi:MAG: FeoB-associated Cys-rich membrane protein [Deltaproteobacteria bacterium]|nr:FeoB-associated Cys-rich membrane protein [Candidatus Dadabacteria bacterium]MCB9475523.1 FeoB-associated Cys-rich membrane protein [Deltaproteobacteria bacterium]MCB9488474.1 FeoB-associated Cys-rich membrane protein [Deltaproteobacteria bacterium]